MSPEKFHPPSKEPEKNPDDGDGVRKMGRREFLPKFAALMASIPILGGCQNHRKGQPVQASSIEEPDPTSEPKEVDADEAKETEPEMRKIIVEHEKGSGIYFIYPENHQSGEELPKGVHERWMQKVEEIKTQMQKNHSGLFELKIRSEKCASKKRAGQIYVSWTYISIRPSYGGRTFSPDGSSSPNK